MKHYLILIAGIVGAASSVFFIKDSHLEPASLASVRLLLSALILAPFAFRTGHRAGAFLSWRGLALSLPAALPLTAHYLTWFVGVRETSAAMSTLIVNLVPVLMPFLVWLLMRERINLGEVGGSMLAIAGIVVLALGKDDTGQTSTHGILVCLISITLCAIYLALGRRFGRGRHIFAYMVPLYFVAGLLSLIWAFARHEPLPPLTQREVLVALGAVVFPTVIGHTALNYAMVHLPSQVVSISNLGQFAVVAILAMPLRQEYPHWNLLLPSLLVMGGALVVIRSATPRVKAKIELAATEPAGS